MYFQLGPYPSPKMQPSLWLINSLAQLFAKDMSEIWNDNSPGVYTGSTAIAQKLQRTNCYKAPHFTFISKHAVRILSPVVCRPSQTTTQARRECSVRPSNRRLFRVAGGGGRRPSILFAQGFPCVWLRVRLMKSSFWFIARTEILLCVNLWRREWNKSP